jgi:hypothetical protein
LDPPGAIRAARRQGGLYEFCISTRSCSPSILYAGLAIFLPRTARNRGLPCVVVGLRMPGLAMLDLLMVAYGIGFFAAAILYVLACEQM